MDINTSLITATKCPECGAVSNLSCWEMLGVICSWEWADRDLQKEHFLIVASYNLQHPAKFVDEAIKGLQIALIDYLDHGISPEEIRRRTSRAYEGNKKVLKNDQNVTLRLRNWPVTIDNIYANGDLIDAATRVKKWGQSIKEELLKDAQ
ncbi:MAG: hypothetical protein JWO40_694 [Candidatus Doudnabacteria bacterium]|nr:hypothetical protein [Candidatus Doudnabacteria bacterium]